MSDKTEITVDSGFKGFGCLLMFAGACVSWFTNYSVLWAILHFVVGPFYLVYRLIKYLMHVS